MPDQANPYASPTAVSIPLPGERPLATEFPAEMRRVRTGLSLVYYGICGILLLALGMPVVAMVLGGGGQPATLGVAMTAMTVLMIVFGVMMFAGEVMCAFVPQESGAKGLALAAVGLQILNRLATVGGMLALGSVNASVIASVIGSLASVASLICFVLFLRKTALYVGRDDVAKRAVRTLVVGLVSLALLVPFVGSGSMVPAPGAGGSAPSMTFAMLAILGGIGMLVTLLMYANTITYLRKAIRV